MENDKKELLYVMNLLKTSPKREGEKISKELSAFPINKNFQFKMKPDSKFETFITNKKNSNYFKTKTDQEPISRNNTIENEISLNSFFTMQTKKQTNQKTFTVQNNKPNLNITKFSNFPRALNLNKDNKWYTSKNYNNMYKGKNKGNLQKNYLQIKLFSKIKIRYLNFRPYVDLPEIKDENIKITETEPSETLTVTFNTLSPNQNHKNYYFKFLGNECLLIKRLLEDNGFIQCRGNEEWTILWSGGHIKLNYYEKLNKFQRMNHFPRSNEITRKDLLYKNLSKLKELFPGNKFDFIPESYILPNEYIYLKEKMDKNPNQFWIIKPVALSQGRGIFLTKNINEIPNNCAYIASKYITNPFLIKKKNLI